VSPIHPALRQIQLEAAARHRQWIGRRAEQGFLALAWLALGLTLALALAGPLADGSRQAPEHPLLALAISGGLGAFLLHGAARRDDARLAPAWLAALPVSPAQTADAQRRSRGRRRRELAGLYAALPPLGLTGGLPASTLPGLLLLAAGAWALAALLSLALPSRLAGSSSASLPLPIATVAPLSGAARPDDGPLPTLRLWQRRVAHGQLRRWLAWGWLLPVGILLPIGSGLMGLIGLGLAGLGLSASLATLAQTQALLADAHRLLASQPLSARRRRDAASLVPWRTLLLAALAGGGGLALLGLPWPMAVGFGLILASASSYRLALSLRYPDQPGRQRRHALLAGALGLLLLREVPPLALLLAPLAAGWQWRQAGR
jgi:hypothetical protein